MLVINQKNTTPTPNNLETLQWLEQNKSNFPFEIEVLDHTQGLKNGVGEARHLGCLRALTKLKSPEDLLVSLDADTCVEEPYIEKLSNKNLNGAGFVLNFEHRPQNPEIKRYETYLKTMAQKLHQAGSPFGFVTLGSALGTSKKYYELSGGFPKKDATEDFHFLNKLRKYGEIESWMDITVHPSSRTETRVYLGTGFFMKNAQESLEQATHKLLQPMDSDFERLQNLLNQIRNFYETNELNVTAFPTSISTWLTQDIQPKLQKGKNNSRSNESYQKKLPQLFDAMDTWRLLKSLRIGDRII